jgi:hypothetical protein
LREFALEMVAAYSMGGAGAVVQRLMELTPDEEARYWRKVEIESRWTNYLTRYPVRWSPEQAAEKAAEQPPATDEEAA